jgi:hypothetical protein
LAEPNRIYCRKCGIFLKSINSHEKHDVLANISDLHLSQPVLHLLSQLNDDKKEAQYFFNLESLDFFTSIFKQLKITKIICIGAPRLHEHLKFHKIKSILLDIDDRLRSFNEPEEFCKYNMFNNYFFEDDQEKLERFMLESSSDNVCIFVDPPFAARTESLTETFKILAKLYRKLNNHFKILPIFWIFPYFMENYLKKSMPEMEMVDYKVNYTNHKSYNEASKDRKEGSPVRMFTNVDTSLIKCPIEKGYKFCKKCKKFVSITNQHCNFCKSCPGKNGATYNHCKYCGLCVKPTYKHCFKCNRCSGKDHSCKEFQKHQECWLCHKTGHVEKYCSLIKKLKLKKTPGHCLICNKIKHHNLRDCPERSSILKETCFLGEWIQSVKQLFI